MLLLHKLSHHRTLDSRTKLIQSVQSEDIICYPGDEQRYKLVTHIQIERIVGDKSMVDDKNVIELIKEESDNESVVNDDDTDAADQIPTECEAFAIAEARILDEEVRASAVWLQPTAFQCVYCRSLYKTISSVRSHMAYAHKTTDHEAPGDHCHRQKGRKNSSGKVGRPASSQDDRKFQCRHCNEMFSNRSNYNKHVLTLRDGKPFFCRTCISGFDFRGDLIQHKRQNRECQSPPREKKYLCTYCGKYFLKKDSLRQHTRVHTKERPFECTECNRTFVNKGTLKDHMNSHLGLRPYVCPVTACGKAFRLACTLKQHKMNVHEPPRFKCSFCDKMFSDKKHMETHTRVHTGEKPYQCEYCPMMFRMTSTLRVHTRTHTGQRPFRCDHCEKTFIKSHGLQVHRRKCFQHTGTAADAKTVDHT